MNSSQSHIVAFLVFQAVIYWISILPALVSIPNSWELPLKDRHLRKEIVWERTIKHSLCASPCN